MHTPLQAQDQTRQRSQLRDIEGDTCTYVNLYPGHDGAKFLVLHGSSYKVRRKISGACWHKMFYFWEFHLVRGFIVIACARWLCRGVTWTLRWSVPLFRIESYRGFSVLSPKYDRIWLCMLRLLQGFLSCLFVFLLPVSFKFISSQLSSYRECVTWAVIRTVICVFMICVLPCCDFGCCEKKKTTKKYPTCL